MDLAEDAQCFDCDSCLVHLGAEGYHLHLPKAPKSSIEEGDIFAEVGALFGLAALSPWIQRRWPDLTCWLGAGLAWSLLGLWLWRWGAQVLLASQPVALASDWVPTLGWKVSAYLDGLSLLFCVLVLGIGGLICLYSGAYFRGKPDTGRFYLFLFSFMGAMVGVVLAGNLFWLFLFWELTSLTSFLLISFHFQQETSRRAALQALWVTGSGGLCLLLASLWLDSLLGTVEFSEILQRGDEMRASAHYLPILGLFVVACFTKSAQFPFHFWLPNAMQAPTPVSAYLHSATMVKAGIFLLARLHPLLGSTQAWMLCLTVAGSLTMILGAWMSLRQTDLKLLLAWTTLSALGTLTMLLGLSTPYAIKAFVLLLLAHACYKGCFFMWVGVLDLTLGTRDGNQLAGQLGRFKRIAWIGWLGGASMAGLPPFLGFLSKELAYEAVFPIPALLVTFAFSNIFLIAAAGQITVRLLTGSPQQPIVPVKPLVWQLWMPPGILALLGLVVALQPGALGRVGVEPPLAAILGQPHTAKLAFWHGWNAVLLTSVLVVALGTLVWRARRGFIRLLSPPRGWSWDRLYDRLLQGLISASVRFLRIVQHGQLRYYLGSLFTFSFGLLVWQMSKSSIDYFAPVSAVEPVGLGLCLLIALSALATVRATTHLASIVCLGMLGFLMALLYVHYSAPDAAMTQFLVETLGVILVTLVLIHLPSRRRLATPLDFARDCGIALLGGLSFAGMAWFVSTSPVDSSLTDFYAGASYLKAYGKNVVNVILVDFRGLDTLGELIVLAMAGLGVAALVRK